MILNEFDVVAAPETETQIIQNIKDAAGPFRNIQNGVPDNPGCYENRFVKFKYPEPKIIAAAKKTKRQANKITLYPKRVNE